MSDMTPSFVREIPELFRRILDGATISAGCGPHFMERTNQGGIKLSRASAKAVLEMLERADTAGNRQND